jgi:hypothetical protein
MVRLIRVQLSPPPPPMRDGARGHGPPARTSARPGGPASRRGWAGVSADEPPLPEHRAWVVRRPDGCVRVGSAEPGRRVACRSAGGPPARAPRRRTGVTGQVAPTRSVHLRGPAHGSGPQRGLDRRGEPGGEGVAHRPGRPPAACRRGRRHDFAGRCPRPFQLGALARADPAPVAHHVRRRPPAPLARHRATSRRAASTRASLARRMPQDEMLSPPARWGQAHGEDGMSALAVYVRLPFLGRENCGGWKIQAGPLRVASAPWGDGRPAAAEARTSSTPPSMPPRGPPARSGRAPPLLGDVAVSNTGLPVPRAEDRRQRSASRHAIRMAWEARAAPSSHAR